MSLPSNRRGFLRGLTTLPLIGGSVTLIGASALASDADAEMMAAIARYEAATTAYEEAEDEMYDAYQRCRDLGEIEFPDALYQRSSDSALSLGNGHIQNEDGRRWYAHGNAELFRSKPRTRQMYRDPAEEECRRNGHKAGVDRIVFSEPWPEAQARADEIVAAWDRLTAERHARKEASGSFAAERVVAAAQKERDITGVALAKMRAKTPHGLQLKAALVASWFANIEDMDEDIATQGCPTYALALSVLRDVAYRTRPLSEDQT